MKQLSVFCICVLLTSIAFFACSNVAKTSTENQETIPTSKDPFIPGTDFKSYWYAGDAEITSYSLDQARYGEMRKGEAVLIFVTEDFLPNEQVKADQYDSKNIPVLKLNATKNFNTGIYPYSILQSNFYPVADDRHAVKLGASVQEWCGHAYLQMNNRKTFNFTVHSYFQGEADEQFKIDAAVLENEIWNKIRIRPQQLPVGELEVIPSLEYFRLLHKEVKAYPATATLMQENELTIYTINYPTLDRSLSIKFTTAFPHQILGWTDTYKDGSGAGAKQLTTTATKLKQIKTAYWTKNKNIDLPLRDTLGLR